jgi:hypothetical protein
MAEGMLNADACHAASILNWHWQILCLLMEIQFYVGIMYSPHVRLMVAI